VTALEYSVDAIPRHSRLGSGLGPYGVPLGDVHRAVDAGRVDAVHWAAETPGSCRGLRPRELDGCARREPKRLTEDSTASCSPAHLCGKYRVEQGEVFDRQIGKTVWLLRRSDNNAPSTPTTDLRTRHK
jgi:hypothetical protein